MILNFFFLSPQKTGLFWSAEKNIKNTMLNAHNSSVVDVKGIQSNSVILAQIHLSFGNDR